MPRGSRPGERRGGRQKGTKNKRTVEAELLAKRVLDNAPAGAIEHAGLGKEVLERYMVMFDELAQHYRPIPASRHSDEARFREILGGRRRGREGARAVSVADVQGRRREFAAPSRSDKAVHLENLRQIQRRAGAGRR